MGFFSRTMRDVAEFLGEEEDLEDFEEQYDAIVGNIEDLHWSEEEQMYCDASVDEDGPLFFAPFPALASAKSLIPLFYTQTSRITSATAATSPSSPSCCPSCRSTLHISALPSSSYAIRNSSGRPTDSARSARTTRSSVKAKTIGADRSGSR